MSRRSIYTSFLPHIMTLQDLLHRVGDLFPKTVLDEGHKIAYIQPGIVGNSWTQVAYVRNGYTPKVVSKLPERPKTYK